MALFMKRDKGRATTSIVNKWEKFRCIDLYAKRKTGKHPGQKLRSITMAAYSCRRLRTWLIVSSKLAKL